MAATKKRTVKSSKKNNQSVLPGSIYLNKNRYWWKVQLPGEPSIKARPLRPIGARYATTDNSTAIEVARALLEKHLFETSQNCQGEIVNIASLVRAYMEYANEYYVDSEGNPTSEPVSIKYALKPLVELFANLLIEEFGPLRLKEVRQRMIESGSCRKLINKRISIIRRMFKWAVSDQIVSPVILHGLQAVVGLKRGRSKAKESKRVLPVDEKYVYMVLPFTTKVLAAMVELQLLTGMRPGEVVILRPCDIDRSGAIWHYYPYKYKTQHLEDPTLRRIISIGPKGQEILRPFLLRQEDAYCFTPEESERDRRATQFKLRKTPLSCGNKPGSNKKEDPSRKPGIAYDSTSYGKAILYAIKAAQRAGLDIPHWTAYQLRHTTATKVRKEFGYESAGAALGHTNMSATAIYAERNQGLADEAALKFG
ncbi:MAG: site-specific integrase [Planctomycetes bacterium]|nr:site-specific integrase [Planctomycetota bacterium]